MTIDTSQNDAGIKAPDTIEIDISQEEEKPWKPNGWRFWAIFPGLSLTMLLAGLDGSILTTSLPTIVADLNGGALYVWTMNGYYLTTAIAQPMAGQLADIFGRRTPMIISLGLFGLGSGLCGGSNNLEMLIAARLVQGIGAGMMVTMVDTILADLVPLRMRMQYMAIIMTFFTLGSFLGPIIGGVIVQRVSWRWVFYINLPIIGLALIFVILFLRVNHKRQGTMMQRLTRIDYLGNFILAASVVSILISMTWGGTTYAWSSARVLIPLIVGLLGLALFGLHQAFAASDPMMPLRVYGTASSSMGYAITFIHGIVLSWLSFFLPVYFQAILEATPLRAGVYLLAVLIPFAPSGMLGGFAVAATGRYKFVIIIGFVLLCIGNGCLTILTSSTSLAVCIIFQIIIGLGAGLSLTATLPAVQAPLEESDVAVATAAWAFARSFGAIWGAAIPSAIFNSKFDQELNSIQDSTVRSLLAHGGGYEHATRTFMTTLNGNPVLKLQIQHVYEICLKQVWQILIGFTLLALPIAICLKEVKLRKVLETEFGIKVEENGSSDVDATESRNKGGSLREKGVSEGLLRE